MPSSSVLKIDLDAIEQNVKLFAEKGALMAMVKANGNGTGAIHLAPYLKKFGVTLLGVAHVQEGVTLRKAGIDMPIFVLSVPPFEAKLAARYKLEPAVSTLEEIEALNQVATNVIPVHLNINTGLNRFGAEPKATSLLVEAIQKAAHLHLEGVMTHFAASDQAKLDSFTEQQIACFKACVQSIQPPPRWIHAANSAAALRFALPFCNLSRIGVGLFGYGVAPPFRPALSFESHLCAIRYPKKGETIGYQRHYTVPHEKMRFGVIPVGYHDGMHRHYKEKGHVLIQGKKAPRVGAICMDFMFVDLTTIPKAEVGDRATLFGPDLSPETVAQWGNTDVREVLTSIGPRTERLFISNDREENEQRLPDPADTIQKESPSREYLLPT
ncbi:MAG: Alanine racemase [Chlamydiales bacterium]|nr:Alanine racemase [Chlamydiales bacterium]